MTILIALLAAGVVLLLVLLAGARRREARLRDALARERALQDLHDRERTDRLRASEERFHKLFENAGDAIFLGDMNGRFLDVNREAERLTGYSREELLRMGAADLDVNHTQDAIVSVHETMKADHPLVFETVNRRKNGEHITVEVRGIRLFEDDSGAVLMGVARDITQRKRLEDELREYAFQDVLTRLPNRRLLNDRLHHALLAHKRLDAALAVLFIDLDRFKTLNDTHGHDVGDKLLVEVALRLRRTLRESDTVARLGGDEFVVVLEALGDSLEPARAYAESVAEKIRQALAGEYDLDGLRWTGSACVGLTVWLGGDCDPDKVLKQADAAMYETKRARS